MKKTMKPGKKLMHLKILKVIEKIYLSLVPQNEEREDHAH